MTLPVYIVDAFAEAPFGGNPAAIIPMDAWLTDEVMQAIAAQNNLSETAFTVPTEDGFKLRWFTPRVEVDLCGHATLAAAHVLFTELSQSSGTIRFHTRSGLLEVQDLGDQRYSLDFPSDPPIQLESAPELLAQSLGVEPLEVLRGRFDYLVCLSSEEEVKSLSPDFTLMSRIEARGIMVTAWAGDNSFVSRFFAPACGIDEDPVTGSAHCTLTPYWAIQKGLTHFQARQISPRGGHIECKLSGERVSLAGKARLYLQGLIHL